MLPRIEATDARIGFDWVTPDGVPATLAEIVKLPGAEADRWLPTHLEALDDVLIEVAAKFGEVIGGGRGPARGEHEQLAQAYVAIDQAVAEYDDAARACPHLPVDVRSGQIVGTASLMSIRMRDSLDLSAAAPLEGTLDTPTLGPVGGTCDLRWVDEAEPWRGARWVVATTDGRRLPATLAMMLFDSSGVNKDAAVDEHRAALRLVTEAVATAPDPMDASGAVDWLLFDWVMAHRDGADSAAVQVNSGRSDDAQMIVAAAAASVRLRARFDPNLL